MRAFSDETQALIDEIAGHATDRSDPRTALGSIVRDGDPWVIPRIIGLVLDERRDVAEAAGDAVAALRQHVGVRDLGLFDRAFRGLPEWGHPLNMRWTRLRPDALRALASLRAGPVLLQLAMCHADGFVREEAIRRSATCADGSEVGFLLVRANDWVKPIRELAQAALRARLRVENIPDLVAALPLLDAMHGWGRLGGRAIVDEIEELLARPSAVPALVAATRSPDRRARRGAYRRLLDGAQLSLDETRDLFASALRDRDTRLGAWAAHRLVDAPANLFASFRDPLLRHRVASVRFGAAHRLTSAGQPLPWRELLVDPHPDLRALAQRVALDDGGEPDSEYRARLHSSQGALLGVALVGLSETGGPADETIVRGFLQHARAVVRRSALVALAGFDAGDVPQLALTALLDESPAVNRTARDLLLAKPPLLRGSDVWSVFTRASTTAGKRAALAVLAALGYWERLVYLLRAFETNDEVLRANVDAYLMRWWRRASQIFDAPSASVAAELRELLGASSLSASWRDGLRRVVEARAQPGG
ncbi:MAG TPA: hypothetical protein VM261_12915 [Kofleriaceae bacterium]|nr:hypothetical protein [Kofleriaceae bacterium]